MQIALIADTHLTKDSDQLDRLTRRLAGADLVIHAGDYTDYRVLDHFRSHFNFAGVWGNVDDDRIKGCLQEKEIITVKGYRLGIFHGHGQGKTTQERAYGAFENEAVDMIVFGHSHQPLIATKNKILMLNPGSFTARRRERWSSYILLTLDASRPAARLILE